MRAGINSVDDCCARTLDLAGRLELAITAFTCLVSSSCSLTLPRRLHASHLRACACESGSRSASADANVSAMCDGGCGVDACHAVCSACLLLAASLVVCARDRIRTVDRELTSFESRCLDGRRAHCLVLAVWSAPIARTRFRTPDHVSGQAHATCGAGH